MGNDPYFMICLHFCIAITLASKQKLSRRYHPTKKKTEKLRKSDSGMKLFSMRYTWLVKLITSIWQMGGRSSQCRQITYYLFQRILKVNQIPTVILRCCDSWVILLQGATAVSTAAGVPDTSVYLQQKQPCFQRRSLSDMSATCVSQICQVAFSL